MNSWLLLLIGLVFCFFGLGSLNLTLLASGFAACWLLADAFGAGTGTALLISAGGALLCWMLVALIFRTMSFLLGTVVGSVIGAKVFTLLDRGDASVLLAVVVVPTIALVCGFLANHLRERFVVWATALGGAAVILTAVGRLVPGLAQMHDPDSAADVATAVALWLAVAVAGWLTQRAVFSRRLHTAHAEDS